MTTRLKIKRRTIAAIALVSSASSMAAADYPIAGTSPAERPQAAPRITTVDKDQSWYGQALSGLPPPYPASFRFLEDQGNWHTPFNRPGMTGPYDVRGWHRPRDPTRRDGN